ncbi:MAG: hypothetical protein HOJ06_03700, partial [Rhodospirillaceae bacterium]|nr:hypothetical protein [Rhodospirillaceae bacterium]
KDYHALTAIRVFGRLLIAVAAVVLLGGLIIWLLGGDVTESTGGLWFQAHAASLNLSQAIVQRYLFPPLWDDFIVPQLLLRALWETLTILFMFFLVVGGLIAGATRDRTRRRPSPFR